MGSEKHTPATHGQSLRFRTKHQLGDFTLVLHGGAETLNPAEWPAEKRVLYRSVLNQALVAGYDVLRSGGEAMDATVAAITVMENNPLYNAGKGAVFNIAGQNELDVSLMLSKPPSTHPDIPASRRGQAITLLKHTRNPCQLARAFYLAPDIIPHPFLSGAAAEELGTRYFGIPTVEQCYFFTVERWKEHREALGLPVEPYPCPVRCRPDSDDNSQDTDSVTEVGCMMGGEKPVKYASLPKGTVGAVAIDVRGCIAVVTSTGGLTNKFVGRIGDTPSMGSGFWAEEWQAECSVLGKLWNSLTGQSSDCGIGVSGTGWGDYYIRRNVASTIARRVQWLGESLDEAAKTVIAQLHEDGAEGGIIGLDKAGTAIFRLNTNAMFRGVIRPDGVPQTAIFADEEVSELP